MKETITDRLANLKEKINTAQSQYDQSKGKLNNLIEQLKKLGCKNLKQADKLIDELDEEIEEKEVQLEKGVKNLENKIKEIENDQKSSQES